MSDENPVHLHHPVDDKKKTSCGICASSGGVVCDGNLWRLPCSGDTIIARVTKWLENRQHSTACVRARLPLCQACLDLVTDTEQLETRLEENLSLLVHFLNERNDGVAEVDVKPRIDAGELSALLSVEASLKTEKDEDPAPKRPRRSKQTAKKLVQVESDDEAELFADVFAHVDEQRRTRKKSDSDWMPVENDHVEPSSSSESESDTEFVLDPMKKERSTGSDPPKKKRSYTPRKQKKVGRPRKNRDRAAEGAEFDENDFIVGGEDWLKPVCRVCDDDQGTFPRLVDHFNASHPETKPFKCHFCLIEFDFPAEFRIHVLMDQVLRESTGEFRCSSCAEDCRLPHVLSSHVVKHEGLKPFPCVECGEVFDSFSDFVSHRRKSLEKHEKPSERRELKCDECGDLSSTETDFRNHCRHEHKNSTPFKCRICGKDHSRLLFLERHLMTVEFDPKRVCGACGSRFKYPSDLARHLSDEHGVSDVRVCEECGETFASKTKLDYHKQWNHRVMICPVCNLKFPNAKEQDVVAHLNSDHLGENTFRCDTCGDAFISPVNLKRHVNLVHTKQFKCDVCGKSFCLLTNLKRHQEMHEGAICPLCGVVIRNKFHLKRHIRTVHEKKKEEKCQFCGEGFAYTHGLYRHQAEVHNYKVDRLQRPCAECGKIFKTNSALTKHRLGVHGVAPSNIKVYPCTRCERKFTDARQLKEHTYSHEGIKPHACPKCEHRTVTFVNLKTHMKWKHKRIVSRKFREGVVGDELAYDIIDEGPWIRDQKSGDNPA